MVGRCKQRICGHQRGVECSSASSLTAAKCPDAPPRLQTKPFACLASKRLTKFDAKVCRGRRVARGVFSPRLLRLLQFVPHLLLAPKLLLQNGKRRLAKVEMCRDASIATAELDDASALGVLGVEFQIACKAAEMDQRVEEPAHRRRRDLHHNLPQRGRAPAPHTHTHTHA